MTAMGVLEYPKTNSRNGNEEVSFNYFITEDAVVADKESSAGY